VFLGFNCTEFAQRSPHPLDSFIRAGVPQERDMKPGREGHPEEGTRERGETRKLLVPPKR